MSVIRMMSGERVDVVIDFSKFANTNVTLINSIGNAQVPSTNGPFITNILQFRVGASTTNPPLPLPPALVPATTWMVTSNMVAQAMTNGFVSRQVTFDLWGGPPSVTPFPGPPFEEDGSGFFALINLAPFEQDVDDFPVADDTEIWSIINLSDEPHPLHVHLLDFRVIDRFHFSTGTATPWNGTLTKPPAMVTTYINDHINKNPRPFRLVPPEATGLVQFYRIRQGTE